MSKTNAVMIGVACGIFAAFPCAWLVAAFSRFPMPMGGYAHGSDGLGIIIAVVMYGALWGGFLLLGLLGGIAGAVAHRLHFPDDFAITWMTILTAVLIDLLIAAAMAIM